jgi:hypothetical protein
MSEQKKPVLNALEQLFGEEYVTEENGTYWFDHKLVTDSFGDNTSTVFILRQLERCGIFFDDVEPGDQQHIFGLNAAKVETDEIAAKIGELKREDLSEHVLDAPHLTDGDDTFILDKNVLTTHEAVTKQMEEQFGAPIELRLFRRGDDEDKKHPMYVIPIEVFDNGEHPLLAPKPPVHTRGVAELVRTIMRAYGLEDKLGEYSIKTAYEEGMRAQTVANVEGVAISTGLVELLYHTEGMDGTKNALEHLTPQNVQHLREEKFRSLRP